MLCRVSGRSGAPIVMSYAWFYNMEPGVFSSRTALPSLLWVGSPGRQRSQRHAPVRIGRAWRV